MHYRTATYEDIDLLVLQRLNFIEVDENSENYNDNQMELKYMGKLDQYK